MQKLREEMVKFSRKSICRKRLMISAVAAFEKLLTLPQCVEVNADQGFTKALLNMVNGLVVQLPNPGGLPFN